MLKVATATKPAISSCGLFHDFDDLAMTQGFMLNT